MEDSLQSTQEEVSPELNTETFQSLSDQKFQHQNGAKLLVSHGWHKWAQFPGKREIVNSRATQR